MMKFEAALSCSGLNARFVPTLCYKADESMMKSGLAHSTARNENHDLYNGYRGSGSLIVFIPRCNGRARQLYAIMDAPGDRFT